MEKTADALPLEGKTVLEIGAGTGVLTSALARRAKRVIALEIDSRLREQLLKRTAGFKNVEINFVDARKFNFTGFKTIFGNLPYHASTSLLLKILESGFKEAVLCLQKEFAERLTARPGSREWSRLSVAAQANADVEILFQIPRFAFTPVPKVDSAIVLLKKNKKFELDATLVNALFQHKNQTVKNALLHSARALGLEKKALFAALEKIGKEKEKKVRMLSLGELQALSMQFKQAW